MAVRGGKTLTIFLAADLKNFNKGITQAQTGLKGFAGTMSNMLGPAAIGAGLAIAGLATKMAVDGVQSALADEEAMRKLALTMENVGLAHDVGRVEDYISVLERTTGVADDELRPAYDRLVRSIGDTALAERTLSLAMDVAAGTGKSLEAVTNALGKAYDGQTAGLSKLGAGIDATILKSGNMQAITQSLSNTFSGQAAESADTLQGRMKVLNQAVDNLGEAFGKGLLTGVKSATAGTNKMVTSLQELEPEAEAIGTAVAIAGTKLLEFGGTAIGTFSKVIAFNKSLQESGNITQKVLGFLNPLSILTAVVGDNFQEAGQSADLAAEAIGFTAYEARNAVPQFNALGGAIRFTKEQYIDYLAANSVGNGILKDANKTYVDAAQRQKDINKFTYEYVDTALDAARASGTASSAIEKLTDKEKELTKTYEATSTSLAGNRTALAFYTGELTKANDAITAFTTSMQANLMAGVDLGAAFAGQFDEAGKATGVSLLAGFNKQIDEAKYFGNVLTAIKAQGGDTALIEQIAGLGPEVGAKLGQQMLDEGLVPTLNEKFLGVQEATKTLAMGLVPEFLLAGQESALTMIDSISETMAGQVTQLAKIGKKIAKPLGQSFKAQLLTDVAAAIAEVEAAGTAARAEARATVERRQVNLTNAAVAAALQNLVRSADARNGAPVTPVNR